LEGRVSLEGSTKLESKAKPKSGVTLEAKAYYSKSRTNPKIGEE
jgi:hypothetical protein